MRLEGTITQWKDAEGFGFITPKEGGDRVFVHIRSFNHRQRRPASNERVTYELGKDPAGRIHASHVAFVDLKLPPGVLTAVVSTVLFFGVLVIAAYLGKLPLLVFWWYMGASVLTFIVYALDKSSARKDLQRTPENRLHLLALLGGWPGALVAQRMLRHKSSKRPFLAVFWITVVLNLGGLAWLALPDNVDKIRSVLDRHGLKRQNGFIEWAQ